MTDITQVLASSLNLLNLVRGVSSSDTLFDEVRDGLVRRLHENSRIRSAAVKDGEGLLLSLGQEDSYIRWALASLSEASYDHHSYMLLHQKIATIFFGDHQWVR